MKDQPDTESAYFLRRAQQEAVQAILASTSAAAAIHQELSRHYSGAALASLRASDAPAA